MKHILCNARRLSGIIFLVVCIIPMALPVYAGLSLEKDLVLVREYQGRILTMTREIYELKENLEWLELKIKRLDSLGQPVPLNLHQSVSFKNLRIKALEKDRQNHTTCLEEIKVGITKTENQTNPVKANLMDQIKKSGLLDWFELIPDQNSVQLKTTLPILFASGSAVVAMEYDEFLKKVSAFVKGYRAWIVVDGFADKDPIKTKQFPSNFELGAIRATNVVHALVDNGVDPSVFKVATTGKYRFPDARKMTETKALERYINITILFETS
ncbi:MAG: OmpA family protein [Desulfobacula sp.]|jgi:flagellar motor protein MotB|nr:OmpA family protein [Desulfobacula sp.]